MHLFNKAYMIHKQSTKYHGFWAWNISVTYIVVRLPFEKRVYNVQWCALNYVFRILAFVNKFSYRMMFICICGASRHIHLKLRKSVKMLFWIFKPLFGVWIIWTIAAYFNNFLQFNVHMLYFQTNHSMNYQLAIRANGSSHILKGLRRFTKVFLGIKILIVYLGSSVLGIL